MPALRSGVDQHRDGSLVQNLEDRVHLLSPAPAKVFDDHFPLENRFSQRYQPSDCKRLLYLSDHYTKAAAPEPSGYSGRQVSATA